VQQPCPGLRNDTRQKRPGIRIFASLSHQCVASIVGLGPRRVIVSGSSRAWGGRQMSYQAAGLMRSKKK
jgi:hypothetical protein